MCRDPRRQHARRYHVTSRWRPRRRQCAQITYARAQSRWTPTLLHMARIPIGERPSPQHPTARVAAICRTATTRSRCSARGCSSASRSAATSTPPASPATTRHSAAETTYRSPSASAHPTPAFWASDEYTPMATSPSHVTHRRPSTSGSSKPRACAHKLRIGPSSCRAYVPPVPPKHAIRLTIKAKEAVAGRGAGPARARRLFFREALRSEGDGQVQVVRG